MNAIGWVAAAPPLRPVAACGRGPVAVRLAERAEAGPWTTARYDDWTVVLGDELPWVDGVVYLGALPDAPGVLVPVHRVPALSPDLVRSAVRRLAGSAKQVALVPDETGGDVAVLVLDKAAS